MDILLCATQTFTRHELAQIWKINQFKKWNAPYFSEEWSLAKEPTTGPSYTGVVLGSREERCSSSAWSYEQDQEAHKFSWLYVRPEVKNQQFSFKRTLTALTNVVIYLALFWTAKADISPVERSICALRASFEESAHNPERMSQCRSLKQSEDGNARSMKNLCRRRASSNYLQQALKHLNPVQ